MARKRLLLNEQKVANEERLEETYNRLEYEISKTLIFSIVAVRCNIG